MLQVEVNLTLLTENRRQNLQEFTKLTAEGNFVRKFKLSFFHVYFTVTYKLP